MSRRVIVLLSLCALLTGVAFAAGIDIKCFAPDVVKLNDVLFIPLQPLAELSGATITVNPAGATTMTLKGKSFTCKAKSKSATANGQPVTLPAEVGELFHGGLCAPLKPCVTALGGTVEAADNARKVTITLPGMAEPLRLPINENGGDSLSSAYDDNNEGILFTMMIDGTGLRRLTYGSEFNSPMLPLLSPDGTLLASINVAGHIALRPTAGGEIKEVSQIFTEFAPRMQGYARSSGDIPVFSSDGKFLYHSINGGINQIAVADGASHRICPGDTVVISPDGKHLAVVIAAKAACNSTLWLCDTDGGNRIPLGNGDHPVFSLDGGLLMFTRTYVNNLNRTTQAIAFYNMNATGDAAFSEPSAEGRKAKEIGQCFTPDGKTIIFLDATANAISSMNIDRSNENELHDNQDFTGVSMGGDGKTLILTSRSGELYRMNLDGSGLVDMTKGYTIPAFTFSPDDKQMLFLAQKNYRYDNEGS